MARTKEQHRFLRLNPSTSQKRIGKQKDQKSKFGPAKSQFREHWNDKTSVKTGSTWKQAESGYFEMKLKKNKYADRWKDIMDS